MSFLCEWGSGSRSGKCWLRESDRAAVQQLTVWDECSNWVRSEDLKIWQFKKTYMCPHVTPCIWFNCDDKTMIFSCLPSSCPSAVLSTWVMACSNILILKFPKMTNLKGQRNNLAALRIPPGVWERERWKRPPCPRWRGLRPPRHSQLPNPDDDFSVRNFM